MRTCLLLPALALMLTPLLRGQVAMGTISGVEEDKSGAVIPGAAVIATHIPTGETRRVTTNEHGEFRIAFACIGEYSIAAEARGFRPAKLSGIVLRVDQTLNLRLTLEVGAVTEAVEVRGAAPLIESTTSSLGQVIENRKIRDLPLNGRNPFALACL